MPGHATGSRIGRVGFGGARGCPQRAKVSMTMTGQTALGSGLVDQSQKMTVAARAMAEKKTVGHLS